MKYLSFFGVVLGVLTMSMPIFAEADYFMGTEIGASARTIRMGNIEGFSSNADSVLENPAGLSRVEAGSVTLFSTNLMGEVQYYNATMAVATPIGIFGAGFNSVGVSDLIRTRQVGAGTVFEYLEENGRFSVNKSVYKLGYSFAQSKSLQMGISGSYFSTAIDNYSGSGFNVDAGLLYQADRFGISLLLRNIATGLKVQYSDGSAENLPVETVLGTRIGIGDFDVMGQVKVIGSSKKLAKSLALNYNPSFIPFIHLSGGYKEFPVLREIRNNVTLGIGLDAFGTEFDYAYEHSDHPEFSGIHYFSIATNF